MSLNDLNQPLHRKAKARAARRRRAIVAPMLIAVAVVIAVIAAFWVAVVDDPDGGRAVAVAPIENAVPAATGSIVHSPGAVRQNTDADGGTELAALPFMPSAVGADPSLVESSQFGLLPRVSPDGRRPRDVYARRSATVPSGVPRIVIVVGGLGLSQTATQIAVETLPEEITLAFAPYGSSLQRWVSKAREGRHEVLLQVPMEPNGPQGSPGEHTLLASGGSANRENLHWVLSRIAGYAGVMNHLGARFTAEETAMLPFIGEVGERGLFFLDDGSSPRSAAATVGETLKVPVLTGDRILDQNRDQAAIQRQLAELEVVARTRGLAIGIASAFPDSVETIARWARDAESRGIVVVPASAAIDS